MVTSLLFTMNKIVSAATVILIGFTLTITAQEIKLEHHLEHFISVRNPVAFDKTAWLDARNYIFAQFRSYGLDTLVQPFNTSVDDNSADIIVKGENIIGIAKGTPGGPVVLVGADYDTSLLQTAPLEDNGAGVAAMLEVARNYMSQMYHNEEYNATGTVVFVAFDINTKEYDDNSAGQPGSYHFLHQWLWPYLGNKADNFKGAYILDSISKYNLEDNSQVLPNNFRTNFPKTYDDIAEKGNKGDFLALITRQSGSNNLMAQTLFENYNNDRKARMFRLLELTITDGAELGETSQLYNHQANYHFWTFQPGSDPRPLPAILLTDTDIFRKPSDQCSSPCTASTFLTRSRNAFMTKISEALVKTLADTMTDRVMASNASMMFITPSWFFMILVVLANKMCH